jgi:hypothetical protein
MSSDASDFDCSSKSCQSVLLLDPMNVTHPAGTQTRQSIVGVLLDRVRPARRLANIPLGLGLRPRQTTSRKVGLQVEHQGRLRRRRNGSPGKRDGYGAHQPCRASSHVCSRSTRDSRRGCQTRSGAVDLKAYSTGDCSSALCVSTCSKFWFLKSVSVKLEKPLWNCAKALS